MSALSLPQRLGLVKHLTEILAKLRGDELNPEALAEWEPGARIPVKFGGRLAGWASIPKPSTRATVRNKAAFLAWVKEHHPQQVQVIEQPYEGFTRRILDCAKKNGGYWVNPDTGEAIPVSGIEISEGDPAPRVELNDEAGVIIGQAWRDGEIDLGDILAVEAAPAEDAA